MHDLVVVEKHEEWQRLKSLVLDSVSSPITRRVYNMALNEFIAWFKEAPRPGFSKATVRRRRSVLQNRRLSGKHKSSNQQLTAVLGLEDQEPIRKPLNKDPDNPGFAYTPEP